jgi:hypothetical protein
MPLRYTMHCTFATPRLLGNFPRLCLPLFVLLCLPESLLLIDDLILENLAMVCHSDLSGPPLYDEPTASLRRMRCSQSSV